MGRFAIKAVVFHGIGDIRLENVSEPPIQQPTDALVRLTASVICGTKLHMICGTLPGMKPGTILVLGAIVRLYHDGLATAA